jgi:hypothetical protein
MWGKEKRETDQHRNKRNSIWEEGMRNNSKGKQKKY